MFVFIFTSQIHPQNSLRPPQADVATQHNLRPPQADEINKNILRSNTKNLLHKTPKARKILAAGEFQGSSLLPGHDNIWDARYEAGTQVVVKSWERRVSPQKPKSFRRVKIYVTAHLPLFNPSPPQAHPEGLYGPGSLTKLI